MTSRRVMALVGGVVVALVAFAFYGPLVSATDTYARQFKAHCRLNNSETTLIIHAWEPSDDRSEVPPSFIRHVQQTTIADTTTQAAVQAFPCHSSSVSVTPYGVSVSRSATDSFDNQYWYTEEGEQIILAIELTSSSPGYSAITPQTNAITASTKAAIGSQNNAAWVRASAITERFEPIIDLLISLMPLMLVISFLASAWGALYGYSGGGGDGGIKSAVGGETLVLVALMVAVYLAPSFLEFANSALGIVDAGIYGNTSRFQSITRLIFEILPLGFTVAILAMASYRGYKTVNRVRESRGMGGGMM